MARYAFSIWVRRNHFLSPEPQLLTPPPCYLGIHSYKGEGVCPWMELHKDGKPNLLRLLSYSNSLRNYLMNRNEENRIFLRFKFCYFIINTRESMTSEHEVGAYSRWLHSIDNVNGNYLTYNIWIIALILYHSHNWHNITKVCTTKYNTM